MVCPMDFVGVSSTHCTYSDLLAPKIRVLNLWTVLRVHRCLPKDIHRHVPVASWSWGRWHLVDRDPVVFFILFFPSTLGCRNASTFFFVNPREDFNFSLYHVVVGYHIVCGDRRTWESCIFWRARNVHVAARGKFEFIGSMELDRNWDENCWELCNPLRRIAGNWTLWVLRRVLPSIIVPQDTPQLREVMTFVVTLSNPPSEQVLREAESVI